MDKLKMHTPDLAAENYKKLAALFPNAVTETITGYDENGNAIVERAIDADVLRQEISAQVVEGPQERYQFTWPDKRKSVVLANQPIAKTLRLVREKSMGRDGTPGSIDTENIYIEGDNLDALKLLQETYLGKVKLIYIDPPYNTGNDFVYEDDFSQGTEEYLAGSGQFDEAGNRLFQNTESNGRFHTDWLNMLYPRLRIAKDLLSDDGAIFISIDDHEAYNLKKCCDEIFGASCFVADVAWQRTYSTRNDSKGIVSEVEHLLCYSKKEEWSPNKLPRTEEMNSIYKNPDNDVEPWTSDNPFAPGAATHQGMVYAIQNPFTGEMIYPSTKACWRYQQNEMLSIMRGWGDYELKDLNDAPKRADVCGIPVAEVRANVKGIVLSVPLKDARAEAQAIYERGQWPKFYFTKGGIGGIRRKTYLSSVGGKLPTNFWPYSDVGHTDEAKKELISLFDGKAPFDTPKPVRLMERILTIASDKDAVVLDFFSGSASMAHAVMKKNAEDNGNRQFIMVQIPETVSSPDYNTLCDIGEERIRRAGKKIREGWLTKIDVDKTAPMVQISLDDGKTAYRPPITTIPGKDRSELVDLDIGFRVFRVDSSNMKDVYYRPNDFQQGQMAQFADNIKEDRTPEDLLIQVMLDLGILLSSKIEETTIEGKKVFIVGGRYEDQNGDIRTHLIVCFDKDVTEETVKAIASLHPSYAVFRDASIANDSVMTNFEQIFETYSPQTQRKVL